LEETAFGSTVLVVQAVAAILEYLAQGNRTLLERSRDLLSRAAVSENSIGDIDSRWVAAHLLILSDDLGRLSVWSALPPNTPAAVRRAFTLVPPAVLTLWPPQVKLAAGENGRNFLDPAVRRVFLSLPTSAGKTLLAQIL